MRCLQKKSDLYEPYETTVPMWDARLDKKIDGKIKMYPPHESLDAIIKEGQEEEWTSFDSEQQEFKQDLFEWGKRVQTTLSDLWLCFALWGGSAPTTKRGSLYLLTYRVLNGVHRRRVWIAGLSKRNICACGCYGRCTFDALFEIIAWSMKALLLGRWPSTDHRGNPLEGVARKDGQKGFQIQSRHNKKMW